ncbi:oligosaccharide flippase family protein [Tardiphaga robiniae]|uniref:Oligosaccharide flippase family protein n=1 Tax=Tardiphaga robiniae TaxID=943830 RepID=A0A7G6TUN6_9BRAD|nr:oligosaccharide flippase family protein [Tardiphaga robiniae]QND70468.1 oligosaccharide flippase family protein [Tardiphaga robiniae]
MTSTQSAPLSRSLKARVFGAGGWSIAGHFTAMVIRLAGTLILSRIFSPAIFGQVAFLTIVQVIIALLTDIGLRQSVIQHRNGDDPVFLATAWTLSVIRGAVITCMGALVAGLLYLMRDLLPGGSVYSEPDMPLYLAVSMLSATIVGFQSMKLILASRRIELVGQIAVELLSQISMLVFIVIVGWITGSIWAYIVGLLFSAVVTVILSHALLPGPRDRFAWDRHSLREMSRFGVWTMLSSAMSAFSSNGDRLLLGGWMPPAGLGNYSIASNLNSMVDGLVGRVFGHIAFPALTETLHKDATRLRSVYFRMRMITDCTLLFAGGFLFASGQEIVGIMYDQRYAAAGWILSTLSLSLLFSRYEISHSAYLAFGRPSYVTLLSVIKLVSLFTIAPLMYFFFGIQGAILGIALHMIPSVICIFVLNHRIQLNNLVFELLILLMWMVGGAAGVGFNALAEVVKARFQWHM